MEPQYIDYGKTRPTVDDNWSINNPYELLTFVKNGSKLYISKKDVPANIELTNEEYWLLLFDGAGGGDISNKEDKSNKKATLDISNNNFYPNTKAVQDALNNKLNCYINNTGRVYIGRETPIAYLISVINHDDNEESALYYITGAGTVICIFDNFVGVNGIRLCYSLSVLPSQQYFEIDYRRPQQEEILISIIPLQDDLIAIINNLNHPVYIETPSFKLTNIVEFIVEPAGGDQATTDLATFNAIKAHYNLGNKVRVSERNDPYHHVRDIIGISDLVIYTRDWEITVGE